MCWRPTWNRISRKTIELDFTRWNSSLPDELFCTDKCSKSHQKNNSKPMIQSIAEIIICFVQLSNLFHSLSKQRGHDLSLKCSKCACSRLLLPDKLRMIMIHIHMARISWIRDELINLCEYLHWKCLESNELVLSRTIERESIAWWDRTVHVFSSVCVSVWLK